MNDVGSIEKVVRLPSIPGLPLSFWDEQLLDALPIGVYICDRDGTLIRYNEKAAEIWGWSPAIGDGRQRYCGSFRILQPSGEPLPLDRTPMVEVLRSGKPAVDQDVVIERPDGTRITVLANIRPLFENGEVIGAVNCFQDISCRKEAEESIKESERRTRELLEALPAAIYTTDTRGRITFYNQAAADLWGCRPELDTATFCGSWQLFHLNGTPMPHDQCPMALALKEGEPIRGAEAVAERPDGSRVVFEPYPTPLHDGSGRPIGAVNMLVDISERKATEQQLRLLASEVDHRAKNMLAVIQAVVNLTQADTIADFRLAVNGRIAALARAHNLLSKSRWGGADLRQIVEEELAPFLNCENVRVTIDGSTLPIAQPLAHCLAMVIHEITTNAVKHGAIRQPSGEIEVKWWGGVGDRLLFRWTETGCTHVQPPTRQGFGMSIINGAIRQQLAGEVTLEWREDGLCCEIDVPLSQSSGS